MTAVTPSAALPARRELLLRASRHPLTALLADGCARAGVCADTRVVACVSGGGDSMAMLLLLAAMRERTDPELASVAVLSVDHGLRPEAAREAAQAVAFARHLGIARAEAVRVEVAPAGNVLDAARTARLAAARACARAFGSTHLLLAHQADDRAEGLLLALARGGGFDALAALAPRREFDDGLVLCRPLLDARREQLRAFLAELGITWAEDPSNARHTRGALRTDASTAALIDRIAASAGDLFDEAESLRSLRDESVRRAVPVGRGSISRSTFDGLHPALRAPAIVELTRAAGGAVSRDVLARVERIGPDDRAPRTFACTDGVRLLIDAREVRAERDTAATAD